MERDPDYLVGMRPDYKERVLRVLAEAPYRQEGDRITLSITPIGGFRHEDVGPTVTLQRIVDVRGGVELLRYQLEDACRELIEAKSQAFLRMKEQESK